MDTPDVPTRCIMCGKITDSPVRGFHGDEFGVLCGDCAHWADGNVTITAAQFEALLRYFGEGSP